MGVGVCLIEFFMYNSGIVVIKEIKSTKVNPRKKEGKKKRKRVRGNLRKKFFDTLKNLKLL